jgi:hypothetical protein
MSGFEMIARCHRRAAAKRRDPVIHLNNNTLDSRVTRLRRGAAMTNLFSNNTGLTPWA